jgi:IS30 family transposase
MTCTAIAWVAILILLPILIILHITESRKQRCRRLRSYGWSQQRIANHLKCSRTTVRRELCHV